MRNAASMTGVWLLPLGLALAAPAAAATVLAAEVAHRAGRYTVHFEVRLDADAAAVRRLLTDYDHLERLSPVVGKSERLAPGADGQPRVRVTMRSCLLFFCRTVRKLESVAEYPDGRLVVTVVPAESDYRYSRIEWRIQAEGGRTRLSHRAEQEFSFSVPPFIGPLLVKARLRRELEMLARRLERLAADDSRDGGGRATPGAVAEPPPTAP